MKEKKRGMNRIRLTPNEAEKRPKEKMVSQIAYFLKHRREDRETSTMCSLIGLDFKENKCARKKYCSIS